MKERIQHQIYGEIVYNENFWTGKKTITVNGLDAQLVSKKKREFLIDEKKIVVTGNYLTGVNVCINDESIQLSPKSKWYEIFFAILPVIFLLTWGNSPALCAIFPVVGGVIGGALGGLAMVISLFLMKQTKSPLFKVLIGIGIFAASALIGFILALALIFLMI